MKENKKKESYPQWIIVAAGGIIRMVTRNHGNPTGIVNELIMMLLFGIALLLVVGTIKLGINWIRGAFSQQKTTATPKPPPLQRKPPPQPSKPVVTPRKVSVHPKTSIEEPIIAQTVIRNPTASTGFDDWTTALRERRYVDAVSMARKMPMKGGLAECIQKVRRAAAKGDRNAMLTLAGCLESGIGCVPDQFSSQFWQIRANADADELAEVLGSLDISSTPL